MSDTDCAMTGLMIDSPDSVDRDDAIYVRRTDDGWDAYVHIANVARVAPPGGDVDQRARRRGRSRYLPDRTVRMLPESAERTASLRAGQATPTCLIGLRFGRDGAMRDISVGPGQLDEPTSMSYEQAALALGDPSHPAHRMLLDAHTLAGMLLARRRASGALAIYDLTRGWATDEEGNVVQLGVNERNAGYVIVQELMIAANEGAAHWCVDRELPILFRNHRVSAVAPPREELLGDLTAAEAEPVGARLDAVRQRLALVLKPATYEPHVGGHYGLNLLAYTHVTSPLRRYPDLINQRILLSAANGEPSPYEREALAEYAEEINTRLREWRERRANRLKAAAMAETRQQLVEGVVQGLDSDDFHRVLKVAVAESRCTPELTAELVRRTDAETLAPRDACQVLFFGRGESWTEVKERLNQWIAAEPAHAITLVTMYAQLADAGQVQWDTRDNGSPDQPGFAVRVSLVGTASTAAPVGAPVSSPERSARSKREARQQAALGLVAVLAGVPDLSQDGDLPVMVSPPERPREIRAGQHPVATLNELSQIGELRDVTWSFDKSGPPHEPLHTCTVHAIDGRTADELIAEGTGSAKPAAKSAAAAAMIDQLRAAEAVTVTKDSSEASAQR